MNILIDTVRIYNFRGIKDVEISLPRVAVLIGANNSGKTSVLKALHLALGDYQRYLSEEDFHIESDGKRAKEIIVDLRVIPVDDSHCRTQAFNEEWATAFGDKIKAEANGKQYVAFRTHSMQNPTRGGFETEQFTLEKWVNSETWHSEKIKKNKSNHLSGLSFYSIEAQRDIHQELKEKSSFVGKVLSRLEYCREDVIALESQIKSINEVAVGKSSELQHLKDHLQDLNESFNGSGIAEITPFPKNIRDLSKHFTVQFGENPECTFSMEYHGMGTRSWASMLTMKSFINLMSEKHRKDSEPFFPILAAEEPEAHLHPNAQKTLYSQLEESEGQVIISTHSPFLAATAKQFGLISLNRNNNKTEVHKLTLAPGTEEYRKFKREVVHSRGEILFSKAIILCEGETEEQALPILFNEYFEREPFELGINFISVGGSGSKYTPFLTFARDFSIPVFIFSDGELETVNKLQKEYEDKFGADDIKKCKRITILDGTDFEGYLISCGCQPIIEKIIKEVCGADYIDRWIKARHGKKAKSTSKSTCLTCRQGILEDVPHDYISSSGYERALLKILDTSKTMYAPMIAREICGMGKEKFPPKIIEFFENIKKELLI